MNIGKSFGEFGTWANSVLNRVGLNTNSFFNNTAQSTAPFNPAMSFDAAMSNMVGNISTQQQDVQAEATKLIAAHTKLLTLDTKALGETLAAGALGQPALARAVLQQIEAGNLVTGASDRQQVARVMSSRLTDEQMVTLAGTSHGRALLKTAQSALADGGAAVFTADKLISGATDHKLTARMDAAIKRADELAATQKATGATGKAKKALVSNERYTADDLKRLYGKDAVMLPVDAWVNRIARGEGGFATAGDVKDGNKLSVGIFQWTQTTGRLGTLMQRYKDVAEREGKLNEFHEVFGGKERAEQLLKTLSNGNTASSLSPSSIQSVFTEAGKRDVFKKAQVELARDEARVYLRAVAPHLPYTAADGSVSGRMMAAALIVKNIGGALTSATFVRAAMNRTTSTLYDELARTNPTFNRQLQERLVSVKQETAGLKPSQQQAALENATNAFKREAVETNVSEAKFLEKLTDVAPRVLYTTDWKYEKYHRGVENRIRDTINSVPQREKVNPNEI